MGKVTEKPSLTGVDQLVGVRDGTVGPLATDTLANQLVGSGPVAEELSGIRQIAEQAAGTGAANASSIVSLGATAATLNTRIAAAESFQATGGKVVDPVVVWAAGNITLSGAQTIDGVAVTAGQRVGVGGQTNAALNGIYVVASGAWTRATDMDASAEVHLRTTFVNGGTTKGGHTYRYSVADPGTFVLGTHAITVTKVADAGAMQAAFDALADTVTIQSVSTIPTTASDGQKMTWAPTGEIATYSVARGLWLRDDGSPLATVHDDFEGQAGFLDDRRVAHHRRAVRGSKAFPATFNRIGAKSLLVNGAGVMTGDTTVATAPTRTVMLIPAGCANREIFCGLRARSTGYVGVIIDGNGNDLLRLSYGGGAMQVQEVNRTSGVATSLGSVTLTGIDDTQVQHFKIRKVGTAVTVTHIGTGQTLSITTAYAAMTSVGVWTATAIGGSAVGEAHYITVYPLDQVAGLTLGEGLNFAGAMTLANVGDPDAIDTFDLTGNGLKDVVFAASTNKNGRVAGVYINEQIAPGKFVRHTVDENVNATTTDRFVKIEGMCVWDVGDGVKGLVIIDQLADVFWLYRPVNPTRLNGRWTRVRLNVANYANGQDCFVADVDGDGREELVVAFQGAGSGSALTNGGIVWYKWTFGADPLTTASFVQNTMVVRRGPWSFLKRGKFLWLGGQQCLAFTCRDNDRQPNGQGGIYLARRPATVTDQWPITTLMSAADGVDVCWIDAGDFQGDKRGIDIVYGVNAQQSVRYLAAPAAPLVDPWPSIEIANLGVGSVYNTISIETPEMARTAVLVAYAYYGMVLHQYVGGSWQAKRLLSFDYTHPSEKPRVPFLDLFGDGRLVNLHADSNGSRILALIFERAAIYG
ncbi:hypothetical protein [Sagittula salina]|uniref:Uncharacterized protein n=1 Tax=Sagittula salina TaxID=2820268 RepID=A0A940S1A6_9RHOB|nr:hypothetical protein [Sagittula salina]MBP0483933.1 hypothetical protein [Sagittula salina]